MHAKSDRRANGTRPGKRRRPAQAGRAPEAARSALAARCPKTARPGQDARCETGFDPPGAGLPPSGLCTCSKVRGLARRLTALYDAALAPHALTVTQYAALAVVARADAPLAVSDLARRLQMDRTTTSRLVGPLEADGLVERPAAGGGDRDQRARPLVLTSRGRRRLRAAVPAWRAAQAEVARVLGAPLIETLHRAADAAGRALAGAAGGSEAA